MRYDKLKKRIYKIHGGTRPEQVIFCCKDYDEADAIKKALNELPEYLRPLRSTFWIHVPTAIPIPSPWDYIEKAKRSLKRP